jgi:hypothetical protein
MANKKSLKSAIIASVIAMVLSVTTLFGTTFAWFTDSVTNTNNVIKSGNLDIELSHSNTFGYDETIAEKVEADTKLFLNTDGKQILWEPGVKADETFRIQNMGSLALKYELRVKSAFETVVDGKKLSDVLSIEVKSNNLDETVAFGNGYVMEGTLKANESVDYYVAISWNPSEKDNEYNVAGGLSMVLAIDLVATQTNLEKDGFNGSDYDLGATYTESKYAFPSEDFVLPENATESETLTTISESPVSVEVPASLLNKLKESGVTEMKVATTKPQIDVNNKTVSFESVELFDQNGKVIDLDALNLGEEVEVTLPVGGAFNEGEPVDVYHDGVKTATGYVNANGDVVYEVEHFCEIKVKDAEEMVSINGRYEIGNYNQLVDFQNRVNAGETFSRKTVALVNDIDLAGAEWTPIGNSSKSFQGIFDGQNHTISNLNCVKNGVSNVGLFGFTTDGEIKNLTVENAKVAGRLNVGVVAGTPYTSKFTNVTVKGHVEVDGMAYVGGVGGKNAYANWENITVDVDETSYVNANSVENGVAYRTYVGGVIGFMGEGGHVFSNITSNIDVIGSTIDVGGITGIAHYGNKFENVKCSGDVKITNAQEADEAEEIGGIAGVWHNENGTTVTLANCEFTGTLSTNIEVDLKNNTFTGKPYITNGTGKLFVNGLVVVYTADQLVEALEENNGVLFANDIEINPANMSNAYGKTGINVKNGQTIDGNGYTLDIKGAGGTWDSGINTTGGIIRNIKVTGSFRGIFINHNSTHSETVVLENVIIDGTTYTISCDQGLYQGLVATNCTFNGWTSFAKTLGNAKFIDCNFGKGNGYAYCRPYATTEFIGCTFEAGYTVDKSQAKVSFENCTFAE